MKVRVEKWIRAHVSDEKFSRGAINTGDLCICDTWAEWGEGEFTLKENGRHGWLDDTHIRDIFTFNVEGDYIEIMGFITLDNGMEFIHYRLYPM